MSTPAARELESGDIYAHDTQVVNLFIKCTVYGSILLL